MRKNIPMEIIVAMALTRLGNGNSLQMCGQVYGIAKSMASIIMKKNYVTIRKQLKPLVLNVYMEFLTS